MYYNTKPRKKIMTLFSVKNNSFRHLKKLLWTPHILGSSGSQTELPVQPIATSTPWSQTTILRMSETNEPLVKSNLTNSDHIFETTCFSNTKQVRGFMTQIRNTTPVVKLYQILLWKNKEDKISPKTPKFSRETSNTNESIISQNLQKHKKKHDSCFQDKNKILIIFFNQIWNCGKVEWKVLWRKSKSAINELNKCCFWFNKRLNRKTKIRFQINCTRF